MLAKWFFQKGQGGEGGMLSIRFLIILAIYTRVRGKEDLLKM